MMTGNQRRTPDNVWCNAFSDLEISYLLPNIMYSSHLQMNGLHSCDVTCCFRHLSSSRITQALDIKDCGGHYLPSLLIAEKDRR